MEFKIKNRMINETELIVRHPETGEALASDVVINTDNETAKNAKYFQRLYKSGDLESVEIKTNKKTKGVE